MENLETQKLTLKTYPSRVLTQRAKRVESIDHDIKTFARNMLYTMKASNGIGLAANQVGRLDRIITMDVPPPLGASGSLVMINPQIIARSNTLLSSEEHCLSFPGIGQSVCRSKAVTVTYLDLDGNLQYKRFVGLESICVQHEIDHLNGVTLKNYMSKSKQERLFEKRRNK